MLKLWSKHGMAHPGAAETVAGAAVNETARRDGVWRRRGQALPLLAIMLVVLIGFTGLALDVSMLLLRTLQQQRAADAAVLAGVIHLPDHLDQALLTARQYARLNGYTHTPGGLPQVTAVRVTPYTTRLRVTIQAEHEVYFMRIFGINTVPVTRSAEAQYALPIRMGCPKCYTFGLGNTVPITQSVGCTNCILNQTDYNRYQKFWLSVNGRDTNIADGDAFNSYYDIRGGYFGGCPPAITPSDPNDNYRGSGILGGYNYGIHVEGTGLKLNVYDPAQYYVQGLGGSDYDTADNEPCGSDPNHPSRYTTTFKLYKDPLNTPEYFGDDVQIGSSISYSFNNSQRDRWVSLWDLPADEGELRVQVVTDANSGIGRNQYSFALGGTRRPANNESIYGIDNLSTLMIISPPAPGPSPAPTQVSWYLASIPTEHRNEQMDVRAFDLGDASCNTYIQVLRQDVTCGGGDPTRPDCYNPVQFRWSAPNVQFGNPVSYVQTTNVTDYPAGDPRRNPYNGAWLTMRVDLPGDYSSSWWKILYSVNSCGNTAGRGVSDRTTFDIQLLGNPIHLVDGNP